MNTQRSFLLKSAPGQTGGITVKSARELDLMREAGQVVAATLHLLARSVEPGMKTRDLDRLAAGQIKRMGAKPSFKGYRGFPATVCISLNDEIVHGIPGERALREGDLVSVDAGAIVGGYQGDAAITIGVGQIASEAQRLIETTRRALEEGIQQAQAGNRVGAISAAVQAFAESHGYSVVREYVGHGIGRALHEEPPVPNYGNAGAGPSLRPGMVLAIEPMLNVGGWETRALADGWTVVTADGSLSAHFENTVAITETGPEVLTRLSEG